MMEKIDDFLNNITMYRLVFYFLIILIAVASIFGFLGILPYNGFALILNTLFLLGIGWVTNTIFSKFFETPTNIESVYISTLILALIITPIQSIKDLPFLFWAAVWTMASKYIFAINKKHVFNPVAISLLLMSITLNKSATWWVGNIPLLPFVLIGGILIVRKIKRADMVFSFLGASIFTVLIFILISGANIISTFEKLIFYSPFIFFASIMLTEPQTMPPNQKLQILYGGIVGVLFSPQFHIGSFYTTPEIALLIGNGFSYLVSPKKKLLLMLKEKIQLAPDIYDFIFTPKAKLAYSPGQYMEWTLGYPHPDSRGNRRYFTLSSSPTESDLKIGVKFNQNSSSYKKTLFSLSTNQKIFASQLAGDFTLSKDPNQKYVFIAGGIGITPFRSMIKYLIDTNQPRAITLFYSVKKVSDIVYKNVFDEAQGRLGIKVIYTLTDKEQVPFNWQGKVGYIDQEMITKEVPDYEERKFYLSGPKAMIDSFKLVLKKINVPETHIKTDYFPGFV